MYDSGKIITGLVIFVLLVTFPFWYANFIGDVGAVPPATDNELSEAMFQGITFPNDAKHALTTGEMRSTHMNMLRDIHATALEEGYTAGKDEKKKVMQCMMCHGTKESFCDSCHVHAAVQTPDCWSCHEK
jgi:hypothetical protein